MENFLTNEEKTCGKGDVVLQKDGVNSIDRTCMQRGNFKKWG